MLLKMVFEVVLKMVNVNGESRECVSHLQGISKGIRHVCMVHGHDNDVDQHNGHDQAVEPDVLSDAPRYSAKPALLSPRHQVLPLEEHGHQELEIEPDIGGDVGCCSVFC